MKIVHIAAGDLTSGAGKGLLNLHEGLVQSGIDSHILTTHKSEYNVQNASHLLNSPIQLRFHRAKVRLAYAMKRSLTGQRVSMFSVGFVGCAVANHALVNSADVLHLHWINNMLSSTGIKELGRLNKPIVWTLRDLWPFTGGCHYSFDCARYTVSCGKCPLFGGRLPLDRTHWQHRAKQKAYASIQTLHPVGISPWMAEHAQRSSLFRNRNVHMIWNAVNLSEFPVIEKNKAKEILSLDPQRQYLSIGAVNLDYAYKGYKHLKAALDLLRTDEASLNGQKLPALLIFGRGADALTADFPGSKHFGLVENNTLLNRIYAASDAFLMSSTQEAFGKTIVEALSSGTPVVCFDSSGPKDMVEHKVCGYNARPFDPQDFKTGIDWCLRMGSACGTQCVEASKRFCHLESAGKYFELYQSILDQ